MLLYPNRDTERPVAAPFAQFASALALAALVAATSTFANGPPVALEDDADHLPRTFAFDVMPDDSGLDGEAVTLSVITRTS